MPELENARHELFAQALASGKTIDDAYAAAGFKPNRGNAARMNANESISKRVREILSKGAQRAEVTVERVLRELSRIGFADPRAILDEHGGLLPPDKWSADLAASISSIEVVTRALPGEADEQLDRQPRGGALKRKRNPRVEYIHKVRFWDKNSALEKIAKHLGMFVERFGGPTGEPLAVTHIHKLDKASAKLIADLAN